MVAGKRDAVLHGQKKKQLKKHTKHFEAGPINHTLHIRDT